MAHKTPWGTGVLRSLGLVFGDIGTSPIYTLTVVVSLTVPTEKQLVAVVARSPGERRVCGLGPSLPADQVTHTPAASQLSITAHQRESQSV